MVSDGRSLKKIQDEMGILHNDIIDSIKKSKLTVAQVYLVFEMVRSEIMEIAKNSYMITEGK